MTSQNDATPARLVPGEGQNSNPARGFTEIIARIALTMDKILLAIGGAN